MARFSPMAHLAVEADDQAYACGTVSAYLTDNLMLPGPGSAPPAIMDWAYTSVSEHVSPLEGPTYVASAPLREGTSENQDEVSMTALFHAIPNQMRGAADGQR